MSSHREAPEISKDPVADSTDLYAFVSPDHPDTVTLIANYVPLQGPAGGPNFYEFGDDVLYEIHIDNNGDGCADITYQFQFTTRSATPTRSSTTPAPITRSTARTGTANSSTPSPASTPTAHRTVLAKNLACPPCNIGPLSTPNYPALAAPAVHALPGGRQGLRRPARRRLLRRPRLHLRPGSTCDPSRNCRTSAERVRPPGPRRQLHRPRQRAQHRPPGPDLRPTPDRQTRTTGHRQTRRHRCLDHGQRRQVKISDKTPRRPTTSTADPGYRCPGSATRCSTRSSSRWPTRTAGTTHPPPTTNTSQPTTPTPSSPNLLPVLYPGSFPNLAALDAAHKTRADLVAILLTGIPSGVIPGLPELHRHAPGRPTARSTPRSRRRQSPSNLGLIGGDPAGFPNGRRVFDDVVTHRAAGHRRRDLPPGRPDLRPRRGGPPGHRRPHPSQRRRPRYLTHVPLPRRPLQRLQHAVVVRAAMICDERHAASVATRAGTVVLELGGDVGVLILATPASLLAGTRSR